MASSKNINQIVPKKKKTSIGSGRNTKYKALNSSDTAPKGYKKKYRGQGRN